MAQIKFRSLISLLILISLSLDKKSTVSSGTVEHLLRDIINRAKLENLLNKIKARLTTTTTTTPFREYSKTETPLIVYCKPVISSMGCSKPHTTATTKTTTTTTPTTTTSTPTTTTTTPTTTTTTPTTTTTTPTTTTTTPTTTTTTPTTTTTTPTTTTTTPTTTTTTPITTMTTSTPTTAIAIFTPATTTSTPTTTTSTPTTTTSTPTTTTSTPTTTTTTSTSTTTMATSTSTTTMDTSTPTTTTTTSTPTTTTTTSTPTTTMATYTPNANTTCRNDMFLRLGKYCYHFGRIGSNHAEAVEDCRRIGAILAEPKDTEQIDLIRNYMNSHNVGNVDVWLGGVKTHDNNWVWMSSNASISTSDWYTEEPNNEGGNERCLTLKRIIQYKWNDLYCGYNTLHYICQYPSD